MDFVALGGFNLCVNKLALHHETQLSAPNGSNQASSRGTPVELSIHMSHLSGDNEGDDQLRLMIFMIFYNCQISSPKFFLLILL